MDVISGSFAYENAASIQKAGATYFIRVGFNRKCNVLMTIKDVVVKKRRNSRKYQKVTSRLCWPQEAAVSRRPCEPAANCPTGTISILRVEEPLVTE